MTDALARLTTFGELLRYLRRRQHLTRIDLAIATGYSTGQISRLEQNQRLPNPDVVHALFVPALGLHDEPELVTRLLALAHAAHEQRAAAAPDVDWQPATPDAPVVDAALGASAPPRQLPLPAVRTKLYVPRSRRIRVARARLLAHLDATTEAPLTLVSAPAGFGKTTLLADWLSQSAVSSEQAAIPNGGTGTSHQGASIMQPANGAPLPLRNAHLNVAWLALNEGDNDPTTYLHYLIAALQMLLPVAGATALAVLQGAQAAVPDTVVRLLLNDLAMLTGDSVLVLDDYHVITTPEIHAAMTLLVEHLPPALHVVIVTRADPPLPLARLRARATRRTPCSRLALHAG